MCADVCVGDGVGVGVRTCGCVCVRVLVGELLRNPQWHVLGHASGG